MEENHIARRNVVGPRDAGTIGVPRVRDVRMSMTMNLTGMPLGILIEMD